MNAPSVPTNFYFEEWKVCQTLINSLNTTLSDIRKYGFTLLTVLLSGGGVLYAKYTPVGGGTPDLILVFGIYAALMVLIFALFTLDRHHESFFQGAIKRATFLEKHIDAGKCGKIKLTQDISAITGEKTSPWGVTIYILYILSNTLLVVGATIVKPLKSQLINPPSAIRGIDLHILALAIIPAIFAVVIMYAYNARIKGKIKRYQKRNSGIKIKERVRRLFGFLTYIL